MLLIDDEDSCIVSTKLMLEGGGYDVETVSSGKEALIVLKEKFKDISVILLDLMLPDISGVEIMKKIASSPKLRKIPVIIQTGVSENQEISSAMSEGAVSCLRKPYSYKVMNKQIKSAIGA
ncbi:MAG: response regulator [Rickettsiales bacterium]